MTTLIEADQPYALSPKDAARRLGLDVSTLYRNYGNALRRRVEARTKREAESKATVIRERHERGENVFDAPRTLGELLDEWLQTIEMQGRAANTIFCLRQRSDGTSSQMTRRAHTNGCHGCGGVCESLRSAIQMV